jgi:primosomal protein N'
LFFQRELPRRQLLDYPPVSHLILVSFTASRAAVARTAARDFRDHWHAETKQSKSQAGRILGPVPSAVPRREGRHSVHALIKTRATKKARQIIDVFREETEAQYRREDVSVIIDVDPSDFW